MLCKYDRHCPTNDLSTCHTNKKAPEACFVWLPLVEVESFLEVQLYCPLMGGLQGGEAREGIINVR